MYFDILLFEHVYAFQRLVYRSTFVLSFVLWGDIYTQEYVLCWLLINGICDDIDTGKKHNISNNFRISSNSNPIEKIEI